MVEQTDGLFFTLPRGPGWRRIDSPLRVGEWSAWLTGWITGWYIFLVVVLFLSNRTTDWRHPQHRLGPAFLMHRASIWPWPDTRVIYQVVPGLVSRWRRGGMHAALVSSWCRSGILGWTTGRRRHEPHAKETDVVSSRMTGRRQSESW